MLKKIVLKQADNTSMAYHIETKNVAYIQVIIQNSSHFICKVEKALSFNFH